MRLSRLILLALCGLVFATTPGLAARPADAPPMLSLAPPATPVAADQTFDVAVQISNAANLGAWEFGLTYDPALLTLVGVTPAPAFGGGADCDATQARCAFTLGPRFRRDGASVGMVSHGATPGFSGSGTIAILHFQPAGRSGTTALQLSEALLADPQANPITPLVQAARLTLEADGYRIFLPTAAQNAGGAE